MTDAEMDNLDKLAAEKVMGWEWEEEEKSGFAGWNCKDGSYWYGWSPTRRIEDAFRLTSVFVDTHMVQLSSNRDKTWSCYVVVFGEEGPENDGYCDEAETAPIAITLAALRAKGIDV